MDLVVVDSGTSTTRVRLWRDDRVVWNGSRAAGAATTAIDGHPGRIREALTDLLTEAATQAGATPEAVICSGMITSNVGLLEVPHLIAPASIDDIARGLVARDLPEISDVPFWFVPGVKTTVVSSELTHLPEADLMRGEEAEIAGLRDLLGLETAATFLHFGSHHKAISVDADGTILNSRTALTGELFAAIAEHTILKSSVESLHGLDVDLEYAHAGLTHAQAHGLARTLFLVRVGEQAGRAKASMTSYLVGALASEDLALLASVAKDEPIVLYGGGAFAPILDEVLSEQGRTVRRVDAADAELAATVGAVRIYQHRKRLDRHNA